MSTHYKAGDKVQLKDASYLCEVIGIHPNFEDSGVTAYSLLMPDEAINEGLLPIETVDETLLVTGQGEDTLTRSEDKQ